MGVTGHRFAEHTHDNHQAWLWVVSLLAFIYSFLALGVRGVVKWRMLGSDDIVLGLAYIASLAGHICIYQGLHKGLGKAAGLVSEQDYRHIARLVFASRVLVFVVLGLSKISVLIFVRRMFTPQMRRPWQTLNLTFIFVLAWSLAAPLVMSVGCSPSASLDGLPDVCSHTGRRIVILTIFEFLTDSMVTAMPVYLLSHLQLQHGVKSLVILGFVFRVTIVPFFVLYIHVYWGFLHSNQPNIGVVPSLAWQEGLICYSLVLATTPCLRSFMKRFATGGIHEIVEASKGKPPRSANATLNDDPKDDFALLSRTSTVLRKLQTAVRLDTYQKRADAQAELHFRPDTENQAWSRAYRGSVAGPSSSSSSTAARLGVVLDPDAISRVIDVQIEYTDAPLPGMPPTAASGMAAPRKNSEWTSIDWESMRKPSITFADKVRSNSYTPEFDFLTRAE